MEQVQVLILSESGETVSSEVIDTTHLDTFLASIGHTGNVSVGEGEEGNVADIVLHQEELQDDYEPPTITTDHVPLVRIEPDDAPPRSLRASTRLQQKDSPRKKTAEKTFPCDECEQKFTTSSNLLRHKNTHSGVKPYTCRFCTQTFGQLEHRRRHESTSHTKDFRFHCNECGKNYMDRTRFEEHKLVHSGVRAFECPKCKKTYTTQKALDNHKVWHTGVRKWECQTCFKRFVTQAGLCTHRKVHEDARPFVCRFCNQSFKFNRRLVNHERLHEGILPYTCDICDKGFPEQRLMRVHRKTHSDERPFPCKMCDKKFKSKPNLHLHVAAHMKIYDFKCQYCPAKYRRKENLIEHEYKHTGIGAYKCFVCDESFIRRKHLNDHTRYHKLGITSLDDDHDFSKEAKLSQLTSEAENTQYRGGIRNLNISLKSGTPKHLVTAPESRFAIRNRKPGNKTLKREKIYVDGVLVPAKRGRPKGSKSRPRKIDTELPTQSYIAPRSSQVELVIEEVDEDFGDEFVSEIILSELQNGENGTNSENVINGENYTNGENDINGENYTNSENVGNSENMGEYEVISEAVNGEQTQQMDISYPDVDSSVNCNSTKPEFLTKNLLENVDSQENIVENVDNNQENVDYVDNNQENIDYVDNDECDDNFEVENYQENVSDYVTENKTYTVLENRLQRSHIEEEYINSTVNSTVYTRTLHTQTDPLNINDIISYIQSTRNIVLS